MAKAKPAECRHCKRPGPVHRKHRLCVECYQNRRLWDDCPTALVAPAAVPDDEPEDGMSAEEVEALIAEQMQRLPAWWARAVRLQQRRGVSAARAEFGRLLWGKRA